jgi:hypothetical protein
VAGTASVALTTSRISGSNTAERLVLLETRLEHSSPKNQKLGPILQKTGDSNESTPKTLRKLFAIWGIESSRQTTDYAGSAAQKLTGETTTARNCGLCEHWLNDIITAVSPPPHVHQRRELLDQGAN